MTQKVAIFGQSLLIFDLIQSCANFRKVFIVLILFLYIPEIKFSDKFPTIENLWGHYFSISALPARTPTTVADLQKATRPDEWLQFCKSAYLRRRRG